MLWRCGLEIGVGVNAAEKHTDRRFELPLPLRATRRNSNVNSMLWGLLVHIQGDSSLSSVTIHEALVL